MGYIKNESPKIGDTVITKKIHESCAGIFTVGSVVKIVGIGERGYDIEDEFGNKIGEIGWII